MFFDREKVEINISKDLFLKYNKLLKEKNLDFEEALNLFLLKSVEDEKLYLEEMLIDYKDNRGKKIEEFILKEIKEGETSLNEMNLQIEDVLMYLGVSDG